MEYEFNGLHGGAEAVALMGWPEEDGETNAQGQIRTAGWGTRFNNLDATTVISDAPLRVGSRGRRPARLERERSLTGGEVVQRV